MDHHQQELRRAAAQAFADSLNKLEQALCSSEDQLTPSSSLSDWEQAVADIEQFVQAGENASSQAEPPAAEENCQK